MSEDTHESQIHDETGSTQKDQEAVTGPARSSEGCRRPPQGNGAFAEAAYDPEEEDEVQTCFNDLVVEAKTEKPQEPKTYYLTRREFFKQRRRDVLSLSSSESIPPDSQR